MILRFRTLFSSNERIFIKSHFFYSFHWILLKLGTFLVNLVKFSSHNLDISHSRVYRIYRKDSRAGKIAAGGGLKVLEKPSCCIAELLPDATPLNT